MDFTKVKTSFFDTTKKLTDSAKELWNKALNFSGEQLSHTKLYIRSNDEYESSLAKKRVIVIAIDENSEFFDDVILALPLWQMYAFADVASVYLLNKKESQDVIATKGYDLPLEMRIFFEGKEIGKIHDIKHIHNWWKNRDYEKLVPMSSEKVSPETSGETPIINGVQEEKTEKVDPLLSSK